MVDWSYFAIGAMIAVLLLGLYLAFVRPTKGYEGKHYDKRKVLRDLREQYATTQRTSEKLRLQKLYTDIRNM
jgi:hypothetical protein